MIWPAVILRAIKASGAGRCWGRRSDQRGLWEADRLYLDYVGKDTFYGLLAALRGQLFSDDDFAEIYCPDNGRDSVPPSLLATALLLQTYDRVSDAEAKARADFDIRWKVALGIEIEDRPFAKSTLCQEYAAAVPGAADTAREGAGGSREQPALGSAVRLPEAAWDAGGAGHDLHPGTGRGEGHLQSVGRRDRQTVASPGGRGEHHLAGMGRSPGVREVPGLLGAPDNLGALELVEQSEASTGSVVAEAMGDAADGDGGTRQTFADAGRRLVAKAPGRPNRKHFPKHDFHLDLAAGSCTCPAGQVTRTVVPTGKRTDRTGRVHRLQAFQFDGEICGACPLRPECIAAQGRQGRRVQIHPQETLLQQARALQRSADYDQYRKRRVVAEHRLARLVQLSIRQARYFGRVKTRFQLYLAATVANLTLVLGKIGLSGSTGGGATGHHVVLNVVHAVVAGAAANFSAVRLGQLWSVILLTSTLLPKSLYPTRAFRPGF